MRKNTKYSTHQAKVIEDVDVGQASSDLLKETDEYLKSHMKWKKEHEIENQKLMKELSQPQAQAAKPQLKYEENAQSKQLHSDFNTIMNQYQNDVDSVFKNKSKTEKVNVDNIKNANIDYNKLKNDIEVSKYMEENLSELQKKLSAEDQMLKDLESMEVQLNSQDQQINDVIGMIDNSHAANSSVTDSINKEYDDINTILKNK